MTNQAAQTMPALPRPYWKAGDVRDDYGNPYNETDLFTDDDMRAMYQQGYAAALSQTAGVADGWKLVPVEPTEVMCEAAMSSLGWTRSEAAAKTAPITPASPMMEGSMKVWSAMLAAAPAASGGDEVAPIPYEQHEREILKVIDERDYLEKVIDRVLDLVLGADRSEWSSAYGYEDAISDVADHMSAMNAEPNPPSAASVSERARDDRFTAMLIGIIADVQDALGFTDEDKECSNGSLEIVAAIRELKEQALTQQRGESSRPGMSYWAVQMPGKMPKLYGAYAFAELNWYPDEGGALVRLQEVERIGEPTTPQPSADAVRELVKWWRGSGKAIAHICADELESLLSAASGEKGVGNG